MKRKLISLILAVFMLFSVSASAMYAGDYQNGRLSGLYMLSDGSMLVTDVYNKVLWHADRDKATIAAGNINIADISGEPIAYYYDSSVERGYFTQPWDVVPFLDGYAVSDPDSNVVRFVTSENLQTLGGTEIAGSADGRGSNASFDHPTGLVVDEENDILYIADTGNGAIRQMDRHGYVTTYVADLSEPTGLCFSKGALYVAETGKNRIVKITQRKTEVIAGVYETIGEEYIGGYSMFDHPEGVTVSDDGTIYVSDTLNHAIRMIKGDRVYTVARSEDLVSMPVSPRGIVVSGAMLYAADVSAGDILELSLKKKSFPDLPGDKWYAADAEEAMLRGIINGTSDNTFSPELSTTRAMFAAMLARMHRISYGNDVIDGDAAFPDVTDGAWFAPYARWSADNGIVNGMSGRFMPDVSVTREQAVTMLYRYAVNEGFDVSAGEDTNILSYNDAMSVSEWAVPAMQWACGAGIINGSDGNLMPQTAATRAQLVHIILGFMKVYGL